MGVESLAALSVLDVRDNRVWDVFEIGRVAVVVGVGEIRVAGNPLVKLDNYRTNIFTYFKSRALTLLLDGTPPTPAEKKTIRANLTTTSNPSTNGISPSSSSTTIASPPASRAGSSVPSEADRSSLFSVSVTGRSVTSSGKKKKGKKKKKDGGGREKNRSAGGKVEGMGMGVINEGVVAGVMPQVDVTDAQASASASSPPPSAGRVRRMTEIESATGGVLGAGDGENVGEKVDDAHLLVSRAGRKGSRNSPSSKPKRDKREKGKDTSEGGGGDDKSPAMGSSPAGSDAAGDGEGYRQRIEALKTQAGGDWMKVYLELQEEERRAKVEEAERKAKAAEAERAAKIREERRKVEEEEEQRRREVAEREAAMMAREKPEPPQTPASPPPPLPSPPAPERAASPPPPQGKMSPPPPQPIPSPQIGHIGNIGPYRRIYDYHKPRSSAGSDAGTATSVKLVYPDKKKNSNGAEGGKYPIRVTFSNPSGVAPQTIELRNGGVRSPPPAPVRRTSSGVDVESGTAGEFTGVNVGRGSTGNVSIPPLLVSSPPANGLPPPRSSTTTTNT
ncbi:hypothetical protein HK104_006405, partial [Borealophlyctis nickersoniae]